MDGTVVLPAIDRLKRKEVVFIRYFLDKSNRETHGNASKSAEAAGYTKKYSNIMGSRIFNRPRVAKEIKRRQDEEEKKYEIGKEEAIKEARMEYLNSKSPSDKKYFHNVWLQMQGWLVQKIENKNEITVKQEEQEAIYKQVQRLRVEEIEHIN